MCARRWCSAPEREIRFRACDLAALTGAGLRFAVRDFVRFNVEGSKAIKDPLGGRYGDWRVNFGWKLSLPGR